MTLNTSATSPSSSNSNNSTSPPPLLVIPGPVEYHESVLQKLGQPTVGHLSAVFINEFSECLQMLPKVLKADSNSQAVILSGSGTLTWDVCLANLCEPNDTVLIINTGYFSDGLADCARAYQLNVVQVKAKAIGDTLSIDDLKNTLRLHSDIKMVLITHVDTSTAVLNDVELWSKTIREIHPSVLIAVDGVCSMGGEVYKQSEWQIDVSLTCSQKAIGVPPGLSLLCFSQRAVQLIEGRSSPILNYYGSMKKWFPIMRAYQNKQAAYFATPAVNLIRALHTSLQLLLKQTLEARWKRHAIVSQAFKSALNAMQLKQVPTSPQHAANTLSAFYFPDRVEGSQLLAALLKRGVVCAGGLLQPIKTNYMRVGTMGVSTDENRCDIERVAVALEESLNEVGYRVDKGKAIDAFRRTL